MSDGVRGPVTAERCTSSVISFQRGLVSLSHPVRSPRRAARPETLRHLPRSNISNILSTAEDHPLHRGFHVLGELVDCGSS